jgi:hypothetical protein
MAEKIKVKAKIDAGHHRKYGEIKKGKSYTIDENDFGDQLFERPSKNWKAPWEQTKEQKGD